MFLNNITKKNKFNISITSYQIKNMITQPSIEDGPPNFIYLSICLSVCQSHFSGISLPMGQILMKIGSCRGASIKLGLRKKNPFWNVTKRKSTIRTNYFDHKNVLKREMCFIEILKEDSLILGQVGCTKISWKLVEDTFNISSL